MLISLETHIRTFFQGEIWGDLSGLMTDEVFQMMHWYCARLTPLRNTALGSVCFCNSTFSTTSTQ